MDDTNNHEAEFGESYRVMLKGYYQLLSKERSDKPSVAIEEVKLRLFLSLLDKPGLCDADRGMASGAPL